MGEKPYKFKFYLNAMFFMVALLAASLIVLVFEQRQYEAAVENRDLSVRLAEELRQSSNDLSKLARNYVTTLDPVYKKMFFDVVAIRDGEKPRPKGYSLAYWDLNVRREYSKDSETVTLPLLEQMKQAGITQQEWNKVFLAKKRSDLLADIEQRAMSLVEEDLPVDFGKRNLALAMLADDYFINTKAEIMLPIIEAERMITARTQSQVDQAKFAHRLATGVVLIVCFLLTGLIFKLGQQLKQILGCSIPELQNIISELGRGDFFTPINVPEQNSNSILGWVAKTQRSLAELNLGHFRAIVDSSDDAIISKNLEGVIASWNRGAQRVFGYTEEEMVGQPMLTLIPEGREHEEHEILSKINRGLKVDHFETQRLHKSGRLIDVSVTISPIYDKHGAVVGASKIARDISKAKIAEREIQRLAYFDALTGLANRRYLYTILNESLSNLPSAKRSLAIVFLDLDNFKPLNDSLGHEAGDQLLKSVAQRLANFIGEPNVAARFGGDEFIVLLHEPENHQTQKCWVSGYVSALLEQMSRPHTIMQNAYHCSASIGVCIAKHDCQLTSDEIIQRADQAMYQAKLNGKNQYSIFECSKL